MSDHVELPLEILLQHYGWASLAPVEVEPPCDHAYFAIEYAQETSNIDTFVNHEHVADTPHEV